MKATRGSGVCRISPSIHHELWDHDAAEGFKATVRIAQFFNVFSRSTISSDGKKIETVKTRISSMRLDVIKIRRDCKSYRYYRSQMYLAPKGTNLKETIHQDFIE